MKKFMKFAVMAAFALVTVYNVHKVQTEVVLSDTQLKNVEALAVEENYTSPYSCVRGGIFCNLFLILFLSPRSAKQFFAIGSKS